MPLTDLKTNPGRVVRQVADSRRPVLLTSRGRGVAVVQSVAEFEAAEEALENASSQGLSSESKPLADHADLGRVVPEFEQSFLPELVHAPFRIVYCRDADVVRIVRVGRGERRLRLPGPSTLEVGSRGFRLTVEPVLSLPPACGVSVLRDSGSTNRDPPRRGGGSGSGTVNDCKRCRDLRRSNVKWPGVCTEVPNSCRVRPKRGLATGARLRYGASLRFVQHQGGAAKLVAVSPSSPSASMLTDSIVVGS